MAAGQDEPVAVRPMRIGWVMAQMPLPKGIGGGGQAHRRAGMARIGLLYSIHGQEADRIDALQCEVGVAAHLASRTSAQGYNTCVKTSWRFKDCGRIVQIALTNPRLLPYDLPE